MFNGTDWVAANGATTNVANYTPVEADEGQALRLVVSLANDPSGTEKGTYNLGTVQESAAENATITLAGLTAGDAIKGTPVIASVINSDAPASGIVYTFQTFDGTNWNTVQSSASSNYTPVDTDVGNQLRVNVSFIDTAGNAETGTSDAGTVSAIPPPVITTTAPAQDNASSINIAGTAEANSTVTLYNNGISTG